MNTPATVMLSALKQLLIKISLALLFCWLSQLTGNCQQLIVNSTPASLTLLVESLADSGVTISNITSNVSSISIGSFTQGVSAGLGIETGIILSSGEVADLEANGSSNASTDLGIIGDSDLDDLLDLWSSEDAVYIEFDLIPDGNFIKFNYVFGSEEYPEYVNSVFNDVFGFFISGPGIIGSFSNNAKNIALIPGTTTYVSINNINNVTPSYPQFYVNNTSGTSCAFDGFTTVLTASVYVIPQSSYHLRIVVGDAGDHILDSGVFLETPSLVSTVGLLPPVISAISDTNLCLGKSLVLFVDFPYYDGYDITWYKDSVFLLTTQNKTLIIDSVELSDAGSYYCVIDYYGNSAASNSVTINISEQSMVNAGNDLWVCSGDTVILTATGNDGYVWNTGVANQNLQFQAVHDTLFSIISLNQICPSFDSVWIDVSPDLAIISDNSICPGDSITIQATGGSQYQWSTGDTLSSIIVSPDQDSLFIVIGVDNGCTDMDSIQISIVQPISADFITILDGYESSFTTDSPFVTEWLWNFGDSSSSNLQNPVHSYQDTGIFAIQLVVNNACFADTSYDSVYIECPGSYMNLLPGNSVLMPNQSYSFTIDSVFSNYEWNTGDSTNILFISDGNLLDGNNNYWVQTLTSDSCTYYKSFVVYKAPCQEIAVEFSSNHFTNYDNKVLVLCTEELLEINTTITCPENNANYYQDSNTILKQWYLNGSLIQTGNNLVYQISNEGFYQLEIHVTDDYCTSLDYLSVFAVGDCQSAECVPLVDENTDIEVCFSAHHTYLSDLGFYLLAPGFGSGSLSTIPGEKGIVELLPSASVWDNGITSLDPSVLDCNNSWDIGTNCNSQDDVLDLCFTTSLPAGNPNLTLCICDYDVVSPMTGTFASAGPWSPIYGFPINSTLWNAQIFDCVTADVGFLSHATLTFTANGMTYYYDSYPINETIHDDSCDPQSAATAYVIPTFSIGTEVITDTVLNSSFVATDTLHTALLDSCFYNPEIPIDSVSTLFASIVDSAHLLVNWSIYQGGSTVTFSRQYAFDSIGVLQVELPISCSCSGEIYQQITLLIDSIEINEEDLVTFRKNLSSQMFKLFPNPARETLFIESNFNKSSVCIYNSLGTKVFEKDMVTNNFEVDLRNFTNGMYLIQLKDGEAIVAKMFNKQ